jgi:tryptophan synthase alpha chain
VKSRITKKFEELRKEGRKAFIPYIMAGAPSLKKTGELLGLLEECGADVVELGVPFTDPLADGPVIQRAAEKALSNGVVLKDVIAFVKEARAGTEMPIILMTYYNPVFKYGDERFMRDASGAGVDGVIVPDLPPEEAGDLITHAKRYGVDTIFLLAPTSTGERRKAVAKASTGFIYYVSITGITGSRLRIEDSLRDMIEETRAISGKPVALGFGVSTPDEARAVSGIADGVIVGSAIVRRTEDVELRDFLLGLRAAIA